MFAASKTASVSTGGYQISRSLRFNSADSAYLGRTPASASNRKTWTWSGWVKRTALGVRQGLFSCQSGTGLQFGFLDNDVFQMGNLSVYVLQSTQVFRDPSAWYHIVVNVDTTLASNRCKVYVNGTQITAWGTNIFDSTFAQNSDTAINLNNDHCLGQIGPTLSYLSGYMTEINFIDGQALTPSSFGETNAQTGVWQPKAYSGSYGTNGFYVNFSDNSNTTAATLGKDYSGNGNNWTPFNFSVSAGSGNDSLVDVPTPYGVDTGVGGEVRGNYSTMNPLTTVGGTFANGNLDATLTSPSGTNTENAVSTFGVSSGKWYCEIVSSAGSIPFIGISDASIQAADRKYTSSSVWSYGTNGLKYNAGSGTSYGATWTTGDVIGIALDMDAGTVAFYKNGTSQGTAFSSLSGRSINIWLSNGTGSPSTAVAYVCNFGQRPFAYTAPSGYKALCTQNLPTPTIGATTATQAGKYFNTVTYTGTQTTQSVTGVGFQPDFVWNKDRSAPWTHVLTDAVRGAGKSLYSNSTDPEVTNDPNGYVSAFNSDGFTLAGGLRVNASGDAIVAWNWKANGSGSTNTSGSTTSTVSANTTSGFSIVTYTGNGTGTTVGHGLGVAPSMVIQKYRSSATDWFVYHQAMGTNKYLTLNTINAAGTDTGIWQNTAPTSSVFSVGSGINGNGSTMVAYCFAPIAGFSAFGSYTGNGSTDGPFLYLGFTPVLIWIKLSNSAGTNWRAITINTSYLSLNNTDAQYDSPPGPVRGVSNGVKIVGAGGDINGNTNTYIYVAFAANPFKYALAQPQ